MLQNVLTEKGESMDVFFVIMHQERRLLLKKTSLVSTISIYSLTTLHSAPFFNFHLGLPDARKHQLLKF